MQALAHSIGECGTDVQNQYCEIKFAVKAPLPQTGLKIVVRNQRNVNFAIFKPEFVGEKILHMRPINDVAPTHENCLRNARCQDIRKSRHVAPPIETRDIRSESDMFLVSLVLAQGSIGHERILTLLSESLSATWRRFLG